jgi:hypothetical protein
MALQRESLRRRADAGRSFTGEAPGSTAVRREAEASGHDAGDRGPVSGSPLGPARGLILGLAMGLMLWALLIGVAWWLLKR